MKTKALSIFASFVRLLIVLLVLATFAFETFAANAGQLRYTNVQIDVFTSPFDGHGGCHGDFAGDGKMVCGHPGHVSELSWTFVRSNTEGDVYQMTRHYPSDSDSSSSEIKEVTYSGKPLTLWQDAYQKIVLRPKPADQTHVRANGGDMLVPIGSLLFSPSMSLDSSCSLINHL